VLAPSTVKECFDLTVKAFNLSEKFRTPVIVVFDEVVGHMREKVTLPRTEEVEVIDRIRPTVPPEWYIPYEDTPQGVPPMAVFGDGYRFHVTGLTHDIRGFPTLRPDEIGPFMDRIHRKITHGLPEIQMAEFFQLDDADVAVIAYGSVARTARRAIIDAREKGIKAGLLKLMTLWPFMRPAIERVMQTTTVLIVPEINLGQISREVKRVNEGRALVNTINRIDGLTITPGQILRKIREVS
jgi:2-oxoglutarate ferredoxin oxidoreductase subunit alpha